MTQPKPPTPRHPDQPQRWPIQPGDPVCIDGPLAQRWLRATFPKPDTRHLCANPKCKHPLFWRGVKDGRAVYYACNCKAARR